MDKSSYANGNVDCGCGGSGLSSATSFVHRGCGCGRGLGEASDQENKEAKQTKKDLIETAKTYINGEIPIKYKIGAGVAIVVLLMLATRGN